MYPCSHWPHWAWTDTQPLSGRCSRSPTDHDRSRASSPCLHWYGSSRSHWLYRPLFSLSRGSSWCRPNRSLWPLSITMKRSTIRTSPSAIRSRRISGPTIPKWSFSADFSSTIASRSLSSARSTSSLHVTYSAGSKSGTSPVLLDVDVSRSFLISTQTLPGEATVSGASVRHHHLPEVSYVHHSIHCVIVHERCDQCRVDHCRRQK